MKKLSKIVCMLEIVCKGFLTNMIFGVYYQWNTSYETWTLWIEKLKEFMYGTKFTAVISGFIIY